MFGGIANGMFMNDLYTIFLAKDEVKHDRNGTVSKGGNQKHFRGRTKRFDVTGGAAPSPRYGHSAVILDYYQGGQGHDSFTQDNPTDNFSLPSFDTDAESDVENGNGEMSSYAKNVNNSYHSTPKLIIIGGFVDPKPRRQQEKVRRDMEGEAILDVS